MYNYSRKHDRIQSQSSNTNPSQESYRFAGCALESVRSFLARWLEQNSVRCTVADWLPDFGENLVSL